jgi:transposase
MILWQICHKNELSNGDLTRYIVKLLLKQGITTKQAARDLNISVERARNWYYKDTGMTALDLLRMMQKYQFVREAVENSLPPESRGKGK